MTLKDELGCIDKRIANPTTGLPEEVFEFITTVTPMINVDLLIKNESGKVLMTWRDDICGCGWHIPGGIIRYKESIKDRILAVARNELNTDVIFDEKPIMINEIMMPQRVRGHFISLLYKCYIKEGFVINNEKSENEVGFVSWIAEKPDNMVMGQREIYKDLWNKIY